LHLTIAPEAASAARHAARHLARSCAEAVAQRGTAVIALSGGETPRAMLAELRELDVPWKCLYVAQVDERVAPDGDTERNLTKIIELLVDQGPLPVERLLPMPVTKPDLQRAAADYQRALERLSGAPLVLDVVHLGLGADAHTASLGPGDAVVEVVDRDVAMTGPYAGHRRMTLTLPALSRARERLWLVTGAAKKTPLAELVAGSGRGPGTRLPRERSQVFADAAASST
jgi:6-phosphogluconolactonase